MSLLQQKTFPNKKLTFSGMNFEIQLVVDIKNFIIKNNFYFKMKMKKRIINNFCYHVIYNKFRLS